jgi:serine protease Do
MTKKGFIGGAAACAVAAILAGAGGYWTRAADAQPGAVNAPGAMSPVEGAPTSFANIVQRVAPAVVSIDVVEKAKPSPAAAQGLGAFPFGDPQFNPFGLDLRRMFPQQPQHQPPVRATGSGFFISADGYIVTNNHVVDGAQKITVRTRNGHELPARVVGRDPATDLAVLKVDGDAFPFVSFEDSARPRVGDWVVAVGNPFGLGGTATAGIVSALGRRNVSQSSYVDYMQIDAPINRGNSGGPTFDIYGRVVGVNTAIFSPSGGSVGIGFDIPADVAARISHELIGKGKVVRGYMGATIQDVTPEIAQSLGAPAHQGALVADLAPEGPAQKAGLQSGDVVLGVGGKSVVSAADLTRKIGMAGPNETVVLRVRREGRTFDLPVRLGVRPSEAQLASALSGAGAISPGAPAQDILGLQVSPSRGGGLAVLGVQGDSDAASKGLRAGDVIRRAGDRSLSSASDLATVVSEARSHGRKQVLLLVARGGRQIFVPVEVGEAQG